MAIEKFPGEHFTDTDSKINRGPHEERVSLSERLIAVKQEKRLLTEERVRLEDSKLSLLDRLLLAQAEIRRLKTNQEDLVGRFQLLERDRHESKEKCREAQQQLHDLMNLHVASCRLQESLALEEVLTAIQEILINMIGSEKFGILRPRDDSGLKLVSAFGLEGDPGLERPTASIPLTVGDEVQGVIVIFELLPHKEGLGDLDYQLFDLLSSEAARALYLADLHAGRRVWALDEPPSSGPWMNAG